MKNLLREQKDHVIKGFLLVFFMALAMFLLGQAIGQAAIESYMASLGPRGPIVYIALKAATVVVAPLSGSAIYLAGGALFGALWGVIYGTIGNAIGISICFYIGRIRGKKGILRIFGEKTGPKVISIVDKLTSVKNLVITRIVLFPLEDLINYAAGISRIKFVPFIIASVIVTTFLTFVLAIIGDLAI